MVEPLSVEAATAAQDLVVQRATERRVKQQLVRTRVEEIIVDGDDQSREVILISHWRGGQHADEVVLDATEFVGKLPEHFCVRDAHRARRRSVPA
jgi:hypothetical protein